MNRKQLEAYFAKQGIDVSDDVIAAMEGYTEPLTGEQVLSFIDSDDGFNAVRSRFDRYAQKAIQTHDEKREADIEKRIKDATEKAKKESEMSAEERIKADLDSLKAQIAERDQALARRDLVSQIRQEAEKRGVPVELAVDLDNPQLTLEKAVSRLEAYAEVNKGQIEAEVNKRLTSSYKPGSGNDADGEAVGGMPKDVMEAASEFEWMS